MAAPDRTVLAVLRTISVLTIAVAGYALAVAAFRPDGLHSSVPGINVGRTDVSGLISIVVSAVCIAALRVTAVERQGRRSAFELLRLLAAYAGVGWVYLAVCTLTHPNTRVIEATHLASFPTEQQLASVCLVLSIVGLFGAWVLRPPRPSSS